MQKYLEGLNTNKILYYNTEAGFVKPESQQSKNKSGYMELVRVKISLII
jgi:hypothetical protein